MSSQVVIHSLPSIIAEEVCKILVGCTHRFRKVREIALGYARQILETFSALMCNRLVVFTLLEILTLMRRSCELEYNDEASLLISGWTKANVLQYSPVYEFQSDKLELTLQLTDDYAVRNEITTQLHGVARKWLTLAISKAPLEVQSMLQVCLSLCRGTSRSQPLQSYLNESRDVLLVDSVEMGAGLALHFSKAISRLDRQESMGRSLNIRA